MFDKGILVHHHPKEKAKFYLLTALFFSIPLFPKVTTILIIIYSLLALTKLNKEYFTKLFERKILLLFIAMYLLLAIGLAYTSSFEFGVLKVQTQLTLLLFPLIFGGSSITFEKRNWYIKSFVLGVLTTVFLCLLHALYRFFSTKSLYVVDAFSRKHNIFFYNQLTDFIDLHPTYFSIYLGFAIFYLLVQFFKKRDKALAVLILLLFVTLFLTSSKSGIFSFLLATLGFIGYKLLKSGQKTYLLIGMGIILGGIAMLGINPMFYKRSLKSVTSLYRPSKEPHEIINESTSIRLGMWKLSLEAAKNEPVFGHGTGSVWQTLNNECLNHYSFSVCESLRNKNSHNQYLNFLISNGLLFCTIFLTALGLSIFRAYQKKDVLFLYFMITMALNFFFESILQRERGIVYFMLFTVLFTITKNDRQTVNEK